jgi:hypothetical protein
LPGEAGQTPLQTWYSVCREIEATANTRHRTPEQQLAHIRALLAEAFKRMPTEAIK